MSELTVEQEISAIYRGEQLPDAAPDDAETADTEPAEEPALEPDADDEPEVEVEPDTPLLAGKYKTTEELERAYLEAQTAIGRQGNELSELRGLRDEFTQLRDQLQAPAAPQYDPGTLAEFFDNNPQQIPAVAQQALDAGDQLLYQQSLKAWSDHDPIGASDFHMRQLLAAEREQLRAEIAPMREATQKTEIASQFADAYTAQKQAHEDFDQVMSSLTQAQIDGFPRTVIAALQSGDQQTKQEVLETLYRWTKAEQAGQLTQAAVNAQAAQAADAHTARQDAVVATTAASSDRTPVTRTANEAWLEQFESSPAFRKAAGQA